MSPTRFLHHTFVHPPPLPHDSPAVVPIHPLHSKLHLRQQTSVNTEHAVFEPPPRVRPTLPHFSFLFAFSCRLASIFVLACYAGLLFSPYHARAFLIAPPYPALYICVSSDLCYSCLLDLTHCSALPKVTCSALCTLHTCIFAAMCKPSLHFTHPSPISPCRMSFTLIPSLLPREEGCQDDAVTALTLRRTCLG